MTPPRRFSINWWLSLIGGVIVVVSGLYSLGLWGYGVISKVATRDYHSEDVQQRVEAVHKHVDNEFRTIASTLQNIEANSLPPRISNILAIKCASGEVPPDVERILTRLKRRYKEIEGRDHDEGHCTQDGEYMTSYEARKRGLVD